MANNIANVTVPAPVIQFNNTYYLKDGQYNPQTINVPCGINAEVDPWPWWAIPVEDDGIVSILQTVPAIGENVSQPTIDSVAVIRVRDKYKPHYEWFIISSLTNYYAACAACCGASAVPIPTPTPPLIIPCQAVCNSVDANGKFIGVFGIPTLPAGQHYIADGRINGDPLAQASGNTAALLVSDINTKWGNILSPGETITWTKSADNLTLTGTGFSETDVICVLVRTST